ncbi:MAG: XdhC family protein [Hyphomicrobium sp.]|jgi:xanthine dehydrogenase accessory factor|nr:XdhC family protein [Hyphomicrobium sp.]
MDIPIISEQPALAGDDVLDDVIRWHDQGLRTVMVTLVGIDGATPRPLGAQMAVSEDGRWVGYLSGGCLEKTVALEALRVLAEGPCIVRYGRGSPYFDIRLPCGSGLDLSFNPVDPTFIEECRDLRRVRSAFVQTLDLAGGAMRVSRASGIPQSRRDGDLFQRAHTPRLRFQLVGGGPALSAVAVLSNAFGVELDIMTPDDVVRLDLVRAGLPARGMAEPAAQGLAQLDGYTAAVVTFHDHSWEVPVLAQLLKSNCFYIGVLGSRQAQLDRLAKLSEMGVAPGEIARMRNPAGLIPRAKSRGTLAVSILAEIVTEAKSLGLLA